MEHSRTYASGTLMLDQGVLSGFLRNPADKSILGRLGGGVVGLPSPGNAEKT